jgi:GT2 family glycosyltransferase
MMDTSDCHVSTSLANESLGRLAVLLVNYNGREFLKPCIESIYQCAPPETQLILEDNASTDGSVEMVEQCFPSVAIVRSDRNLGFAGGNNLAAKSAKARFLLLLNTDVVLLDPISPVLEWLESHPSYGAVSIEMLDRDFVSQACTGRFPTPMRLLLLRSMLVSPKTYERAKSSQIDSAYKVDWVQGSFLLIRADLWKGLNGLNESFFMYGEDVELCKRIQLSGLQCGYLRGYRYLHWGGFNVARFPEQICGLVNYADRHFNRVDRSLGRAVLILGCLFRAAIYGIAGMLKNGVTSRSKAKASLEAFRRLISQDVRRVQ